MEPESWSKPLGIGIYFIALVLTDTAQYLLNDTAHQEHSVHGTGSKNDLLKGMNMISRFSLGKHFEESIIKATIVESVGT